MGRRSRNPTELRRRPFTLQEARAAGLTRHSLRGKAWRRIGTGLYCRRGLRDDPFLLLTAWSRLLPAGAVFAGPTAAWLWGIELQATNPVEVIVAPGAGVRSRLGLTVRRHELEADEIREVRGLRATSVLRTLRDLCLHLTPVDVLAAIDAALRLELTKPSDLVRYADGARGLPGAKRLSALAPLAAPAESPMETRLRWILLEGGLPCPEVQLDVREAGGRFVGRADLCYPDARLVIEYDGGNHRDRLIEDDRRQNLIINAGFRLLRFTAPDLQSPENVVAQVQQALREGRA